MKSIIEQYGGFANLPDDAKLGFYILWFDDYFDKQLKQSQWQKNFKVSPDPYFKDENGNPKTYADVEELKEKAELVASEIRKLREELNNVNRL